VYGLSGADSEPRSPKSFYCLEHRGPGMRDVVHPTCTHPACLARDGGAAQAVGGLVGSPPSRCIQHLEPRMARDPLRRCSVAACPHHAVYQRRTEARRGLCAGHYALLGEDERAALFLAVGVPCQGCGEEAVVGADGRCLHTCGSAARGERMRKQRAATEALKRLLPDAFAPPLRVREDRVVEVDGERATAGGGLSRTGRPSLLRPDLLFVAEDRLVFVEVDEHAHRYYAAERETRRMLELSFQAGMRPAIWIRFNPDKYGATKVHIARRHRVLADTLRWALRDWKPPPGPAPPPQVVLMYYPGHPPRTPPLPLPTSSR